MDRFLGEEMSGHDTSNNKRKDAPTAEAVSRGCVVFHSVTKQCQEPSKKQQKRAEKKPQKPSEEKKVLENRGVYATNIPRDATIEEVEEAFKKAGIIDHGADGKPRIKMYADSEGNFNGEVLVVYFKKEAVQMAIMRLDGWEFRLGDTSNGVIKVQEADTSYRKNNDGAVIATKMVRKDRKAVERQRAEMNR